jgi:transcriptional regulator with XRE-family HTH domain
MPQSHHRKAARGRPKKSPERILQEQIGKNIKSLRIGRNWSQTELATNSGCGLYQRAISLMERGKQGVCAAQLVAIAQAFDVEVSRLLPKNVNF